MTVTFTTEIDPTAARIFRLTCQAAGPLGEWTGYRNAYTEAHAHALVCADPMCATYGAHVDEIVDVAEVNMSNVNAQLVLDALGYSTEELSGCDSPEAFLGRVLMALAIAPLDEGAPAYELSADEALGLDQILPGGRHVDCGRRPGYLQERLGQLRELAAQAQAVGRAITWS